MPYLGVATVALNVCCNECCVESLGEHKNSRYVGVNTRTTTNLTATMFSTGSRLTSRSGSDRHGGLAVVGVCHPYLVEWKKGELSTSYQHLHSIPQPAERDCLWRRLTGRGPLRPGSLQSGKPCGWHVSLTRHGQPSSHCPLDSYSRGR